MSELSIIVVTWNGKDFVRQCLASIQNAVGLSSEVFVVDNASSDGTPEMIECEFPAIKLIRNTRNLGFARANNIALRIAASDYVALINSDMIVPPECVERMLEYMRTHVDVGVLGPKMLLPDGSVGPSCMRRPTLLVWLVHAVGLGSVLKSYALHIEPSTREDAQDVDVLNGWFWVARNRALREVGLLDEQFFMYGEDIDWCYRFHKHGWRVVYYPGASAFHFVGGSAKRAPVRYYLELQRANLAYWRKHHKRLSQAAYWTLVMLHQVVHAIGYGILWLLNISDPSEASHKVERSVACMAWLCGLKQIEEVGQTE